MMATTTAGAKHSKARQGKFISYTDELGRVIQFECEPGIKGVFQRVLLRMTNFYINHKIRCTGIEKWSGQCYLNPVTRNACC
jgi:hypothetical protein